MPPKREVRVTREGDTNIECVKVVRADAKGFIRASADDYQRPAQGTKQEQLTKTEIKEKLKGCIEVSSKELIDVRPGTWIRYIDKKSGKFRTGGILSMVVCPTHIILKNPYNMLSWSAQMKTNTFYVPDPKKAIKKQREEEKMKEIYDAYKRGDLVDPRRK